MVIVSLVQAACAADTTSAAAHISSTHLPLCPSSRCFLTHLPHPHPHTLHTTHNTLQSGLGSLPSEIAVFHPEDEEHRYIQRRIRDNPMWTLDRGTGYYVQERISKKKASLLGSDK